MIAKLAKAVWEIKGVFVGSVLAAVLMSLVGIGTLTYWFSYLGGDLLFAFVRGTYVVLREERRSQQENA